MAMPRGVLAIDLMMQVPSDDNSKWYEFLKPLLLDRESREAFKFPAQYMFKDVPTTRPSNDHVGVLLDLLAAVEAATTTHIDPVFTSPRAGDVRHSFADLSNIARDLGYKPAVGLTDGMRRTVEWFVAHEQSGSAGG